MYPNFKILYFFMGFTALAFICLFLAVLGLHCCMRTFPSCGWSVVLLPQLLLLQSTGSKALT